MGFLKTLHQVVGVASLVLSAGCGVPAATPVPTPTPVPTSTPVELVIARQDFSGFSHFSFAQEEAWGMLLPELGIFEVDISRHPNGEYLLEISVAELGTSGVDQCLRGIGVRCVKIVQLPERTLTPAEVDAVLNAFSEVDIVSTDPYPVECEQPAYRPHYRWDSFGVADGLCFPPPRLASGQGQMLNDLLNQLAAKSREGIPASTPRPPRCTTYDLFTDNVYVWDIEIAPDHRVWIASRMGAVEYDPIQNSWTTHTTEQGLLSNEVRTVIIGKDGSVWLTSWYDVGVSRYDGEKWKSYTMGDGLPSNEVFDVAIGKDDTIWFATGEGVSRWDPATNIWISHGREEALAGYLVSRIHIANDGSVWFSGNENATHLTFNEKTGEAIWKNYNRDSAKPFGVESVVFREMVVGSDGKVWAISGGGNIIILNPQTGIWSTAPCCPWPVTALALNDDGGLWAGLPHDGVDFVPQPMGGRVDSLDLLHLDTTDGLASNDVHRIAIESDTEIWVVTDKGVSRCETRQ